MTKVQICGVRTLGDALMCEESGADAIGFVSAEGRKRDVPLEEIKRIIGQLGPFITPTLICFPKTAGEAVERASAVGAKAVQVYTLGAAELGRIRQRGLSVVRVVPVDPETGKPDISEEKLKEVSGACDLILFEPSLNGKAGGMGIKYDYGMLKPLVKYCRRFGIAGGLNPENVNEALKLGPYAIDVSSGVESGSGAKDPALVRAFIKRCRGSSR